MITCPHGVTIGSQAPLAAEEAASWGKEDYHVLEFYTACDCCDFLMHKDYAGVSYAVLEDGRTLCSICCGNKNLPVSCTNS